MKFTTLVLATAVALFGDQSPYRCKMSGNQLEADIIVIGGGAVGCVLMNQLSENGRFSVFRNRFQNFQMGKFIYSC